MNSLLRSYEGYSDETRTRTGGRLHDTELARKRVRSKLSRLESARHLHLLVLPLALRFLLSRLCAIFQLRRFHGSVGFS
jgi:hypothetical protein